MAKLKTLDDQQKASPDQQFRDALIGLVNPSTGLANDYLNVFNEILLLIEFLPTMPEMTDEALAWRPRGYLEYFEQSPLPGAQEVMQALAMIDAEVPDWRYVCKVWPQPRTDQQNLIDLKLAADLGIGDKVIYSTNVVSQNFMPYLLSACDIYAAPSRLEGFGMIQVEANACEKPVIAIDAMAFRDTMVHCETAFLASVAEERKITEALYGEGHDYEKSHRIVFPNPRTAEYRASVTDVAKYLRLLMQDSALRQRMGEAGRKRVVERFDYRQVARQFVKIVSDRLGIQ